MSPDFRHNYAQCSFRTQFARSRSSPAEGANGRHGGCPPCYWGNAFWGAGPSLLSFPAQTLRVPWRPLDDAGLSDAKLKLVMGFAL